MQTLPPDTVCTLHQGCQAFPPHPMGHFTHIAPSHTTGESRLSNLLKDVMNLIARAKDVLLMPKPAWTTIVSERTDGHAPLAIRHPLNTLPAVTKFVGTCARILAFLMLAASTSFASEESTADHPEVARFPGFHIDSGKHNDFNEFLFASQGYDDNGEPRGETKAGKYWFIDYVLNENTRQPSATELLRNYENAFKRAGGGLISRTPKTGEPRDAVFRMPLVKGGERWAQIHIDNDGERYQLNIVDVGIMAQKLEFSANEMADTLRKTGHIALTGILFDTAQASLKAESTPLLNEVLVVLRNDTSLRLAVEGHTDNVGNAKANLDLSLRRAGAVVAFLTKAGITPQRLKAVGKGDTVAVADNRTESGRAKNRRVELVKF